MLVYIYGTHEHAYFYGLTSELIWLKVQNIMNFFIISISLNGECKQLLLSWTLTIPLNINEKLKRDNAQFRSFEPT